jgi:predicted aldo/keto reductase-like oxidoreductase
MISGHTTMREEGCTPDVGILPGCRRAQADCTAERTKRHPQDIDEEEGVHAVHEAFRLGINYFDTSPFYGSTRSEQVSPGGGMAETATVICRRC